MGWLGGFRNFANRAKNMVEDEPSTVYKDHRIDHGDRSFIIEMNWEICDVECAG